MSSIDQKPPDERQLLDLAIETLRSRLPTPWSLRADRGLSDARVVVRAPDGRRARISIEAKTLLNARDVPVLAERAKATGEAKLMVTRYLSPRAREALSAAGFSYVDATGNVRIRIDAPAVFIEAAGASGDPWRTPDRPTNSLRGRPAARIVRALADMRGPWKVRDLAAAAGASLGSTARTLDFLDREALVGRDSGGTVITVEWRAMIARWATEYDLARYPRILRLIEPRGIERIESALRDKGARYVISGSLAARRRAPYAEPRLAVVYADDADRMKQRLGLRETDVGANVLIVEPKDDLPFVRTWTEAGSVYAALPQVAVDLLAGPGRNPEEGVALLRWMEQSEAEWRLGK